MFIITVIVIHTNTCHYHYHWCIYMFIIIIIITIIINIIIIIISTIIMIIIIIIIIIMLLFIITHLMRDPLQPAMASAARAHVKQRQTRQWGCNLKPGMVLATRVPCLASSCRRIFQAMTARPVTLAASPEG